MDSTGRKTPGNPMVLFAASTNLPVRVVVVLVSVKLVLMIWLLPRVTTGAFLMLKT